MLIAIKWYYIHPQCEISFVDFNRKVEKVKTMNHDVIWIKIINTLKMPNRLLFPTTNLEKKEKLNEYLNEWNQWVN